MKRYLTILPVAIVLLIGSLFLLHGPILQFAHYHEFADHSVFFGVPHAADVFSNIGFFFVAIWGLWTLWPMRNHPALISGWPGYRLFLFGLLFTSIGSSFYHLDPDNARLISDRLPIAIACAGLLAGVRSETKLNINGSLNATSLFLFAIFSVIWWFVTDRNGVGDLRPYLFLQGLPIILVPLWQKIYNAPSKDRIAFAVALLIYVLAKIAEVNDYQILSVTTVISGHTLKHLLAAGAAALIVGRLIARVQFNCNKELR